MKNEHGLSKIQITELTDEAIINSVTQQQKTFVIELSSSELNLIRGGTSPSELNLMKGETTLVDKYKSVNVWC